MNAIEVSHLHKEYKTKQKAAGMRGALQALLHPEYRAVTAVHDISFTVPSGETVAFIGPNGAGKSTTIKMLSGILHPSAGEARVLGLTPWRQRKALAYKIGAVFGQKSQLWYHLPPVDSLELLGRIYEIPPSEYRARVQWLAGMFDLEPLLRTPVRKLSLGERMRCEIAACLLHRPQLIFLDEPTIGLDVVAKKRMRELIREMNRTEGVTVFLTSHDVGDMEEVCKRVMVINHGELALDSPLAKLRYNYLQTKIVGVRLNRTLTPNIPGVTVIKQKNNGMKLQVDTATISVHQALQYLMQQARVEDITINDPPLELIIRQIYEQGRLAGAPA